MFVTEEAPELFCLLGVEPSNGRGTAEIPKLLTRGASSTFHPKHAFEGNRSRNPTRLLCPRSSKNIHYFVYY